MLRRRFLTAGGIALVQVIVPGLASGAELRASKPDVRKQVVTTIELQLSAFRANDIAKAYALAAAPLRAQKPLATFSSIVRTSYPEIWANRRAEFGIVRDDGKRATVVVQVYSKTSDAAYDYTLVRESAGWRIEGVLRHEPKKPKL